VRDCKRFHGELLICFCDVLFHSEVFLFNEGKMSLMMECLTDPDSYTTHMHVCMCANSHTPARTLIDSLLFRSKEPNKLYSMFSLFPSTFTHTHTHTNTHTHTGCAASCECWYCHWYCHFGCPAQQPGMYDTWVCALIFYRSYTSLWYCFISEGQIWNQVIIFCLFTILVVEHGTSMMYLLVRVNKQHTPPGSSA